VGAGTAVHLSVHDKDTLSTDDPMGSCRWAFNPWPALTEAQLRAQAAAYQREEQLLQRHARRHPSSQQHQLNAGLRWRSWQGAARRQSSIRGSSVLDVDLAVDHPAFEGRCAGRLHLQVAYRASAAPGAARMRGPVRFRQNLCPVAGLFLGKWGADEVGCLGAWVLGGAGCWGFSQLRLSSYPIAFITHKLSLPTAGTAATPQMLHSVFKLQLHDIAFYFPPDQRCPWNRSHGAAAAIFNSTLALSSVRAQHAALYAQGSGIWRALRAWFGGRRGGGLTRDGVLSGASEFLQLINCGLRDGEPR